MVIEEHRWSTAKVPVVWLLRPGEARRVFSLSVPIWAGQMSPAVAGVIEVAMVGRLGAEAVAALGFGGLVFWVIVSLTIGVEAATQTLTARRLGEGRHSAAGAVLTEALRVSVLLGLPLGCVIAWLAPLLMGKLHADSTVRELGGDYLAARALGLCFVMGVAAFRGFYNGMGRPVAYLRVAVVVLGVQILLNYLLIPGGLGLPQLGVAGAGVSATTAQALGLGLLFIIARRNQRHGGFRRAASADERRQVRASLLQVGLPSGVQWALSWVAMLVFQFFSGLVGVVTAGASYLLLQVASMMTLSANSFGFAAASLVSRAMGERQPDVAYRWGLVSGGLAAVVLGGVGLAAAAFREPLLLALTADAQLVALAMPALLLIGLLASLDAFGIVMNFAMLGAGEARRVMTWNLAAMWLICLPLAWLLGVHLSGAMLGLWGSLLGSRLLVALVMTFNFQATALGGTESQSSCQWRQFRRTTE